MNDNQDNDNNPIAAMAGIGVKTVPDKAAAEAALAMTTAATIIVCAWVEGKTITLDQAQPGVDSVHPGVFILAPVWADAQCAAKLIAAMTGLKIPKPAPGSPSGRNTEGEDQ